VTTIEVEQKGRDAIITVKRTRRRFFLFGPMVLTVRRYRGSCTVWHDAETGRRMPTHTELWLSDIWTKWRWNTEDAAAGPERP
jgi:hypothetical protein